MPLKVTFQQALSEVKNRIDILSVISKHLSVKKAGNSFVAVCPFHADKSPSLHISSQKGIYKCFACGASGDTIKFLTEYKKISFIEAVRELAAECGLEIMSKSASPEMNEGQQLILKLNRLACDFWKENLKKHSPSLQYLKENRKLTESSITEFELGYSLPDRKALYNHFNLNDELKAELSSDQILENSGLFIQDQKTGEYIDRFRGRIMIPIKNLDGQIVAFGARSLDPNLQPKYLNSPETPVYHKSHHLYGFNIARNFTRDSKQVLLLEGYFDVIQAHQAGLKFAVGSLGTALTREQASLLYGSNLNRKITLGFDSDLAGLRALQSSLHVFQEAGFSQKPELKALVLKEVKDIDEFLQTHSGEEALNLLQSTQPAYQFLIARRVETVDMHDATSRSNALTDLAELIKDIRDPIEKEILAEEIARALSFNKSTVMQLVKPELPKSNPSQTSFQGSAKKNWQKSNSSNERRFGNNSSSQRKRLLPKPSNDASKTLISLLLLIREESSIQKIKEITLKDPQMQAVKEKLLAMSVEERLALLESDEESAEFREYAEIALWHRDKLFDQVLTECEKKLAEDFSPAKRLSQRAKLRRNEPNL